MPRLKWIQQSGRWFLLLPEGNLTVARVEKKLFHASYKPFRGTYERIGNFKNLDLAKAACLHRLQRK